MHKLCNAGNVTVISNHMTVMLPAFHLAINEAGFLLHCTQKYCLLFSDFVCHYGRIPFNMHFCPLLEKGLLPSCPNG